MIRERFARMGRLIRGVFHHDDPDSSIPLEQWLLDRLPEDYRLAVWLYFCEGMTFSEVAETLTVSEAGVRGRLREGLKLFQRHLVRLGIAAPARAVVLALSNGQAGVAPKRLLKNLGETVRVL